MKRFIAACILFAVLPSLASAQTVPRGYRLVCRNGICSLVRIQPIATRPVVAALPAQYATFTPEPMGSAAVSFASNVTYTDPAPLPAAPVAAAGTTCDCARTGICTCDPALCQCPSCLNGMVRMGGGVTQYAAGSPYSYWSVNQPTVMSYATPAYAYFSPRSLVATSYDGFGNVYTSPLVCGAYARRVARHIRRGVRLGIE